MVISVTPAQVFVGFCVLAAVVFMWRVGSRRARRAAEAARASTRVVSVGGRVAMLTGAMIVVQWLAFTRLDDTTLRIVVLALPDLVAAFVVTRALTVTDIGTTRRRGGRR